MRRRDFIKGVAVSTTIWPISGRAQRSSKPLTIGFLGPNARAWRPRTAAFVERLRELGWIENQTITIEYRWDDANAERDADIAAEFVHREVDVIARMEPPQPFPSG
jgi:putative ABC transport system substrate-binding protein